VLVEGKRQKGKVKAKDPIDSRLFSCQNHFSRYTACTFYHNHMATSVIEDVFDQGTISMSLVGVQALTAFPAELAKS